MNAAEQETERDTPVIFTWAEREASSWWLAAFIFLSFLAHSAAFFIFQGKSPAAPRTIRTAPFVQILSATHGSAVHSPENDALLKWIATHDPALVANTQGVEPKGLLNVPYVPSFQTPRTPPLGAPAETETLQIPPARDPLALIRSVSPATKFSQPILAPRRTQLRLSAALEARAGKFPPMIPRTKVTTPVQPTVVFAGVTGEGETRFAFVQQTSGNGDLDHEGDDFVHTLRFAPASETLHWDIIAIEWGDEVFAPAASK